MGFEPTNNGFADRAIRPLWHLPIWWAETVSSRHPRIFSPVHRPSLLSARIIRNYIRIFYTLKPASTEILSPPVNTCSATTWILGLWHTPLRWRQGWDLNPRALSHHLFSRQIPSTSRTPCHNGADGGDRTHDLILTKDAPYQTVPRQQTIYILEDSNPTLRFC